MNDNNPLIVIDDIIGADLESVNPSDIETMTVLKMLRQQLSTVQELQVESYLSKPKEVEAE